MAGPRSTGDIEEQRPKSRRIDPLRGLFPFVLPYKRTAVVAVLALILTACVSLALPLAVRRVIDGFNNPDVGLMDKYFAAAIALAGLLAIGTGFRYYFVTRLGERVVADIRKAVYDRMIGMSPEFFERIMTGEVLSRITTDTTLILSVISSSLSIAMRNSLIFGGGLVLMLVTSSKLTGLVLLVVPLVIVPIIVLGRRVRALSRENQDMIAASSGNASETLQAAQTVQAFSHEAASRSRFGRLNEAAFEAAKKRIGTRAVTTVIVIFLIFTGVVGVLWIGARDVRAGGMSTGALVQFVIYAVMVAGAAGSLSEIWGELQRAAGATDRLVELLNSKDSIAEPKAPLTLQEPVRGEIEFRNVTFHYPSRRNAAALEGFSLTIKPGETVALVGPSGAGKSTVFQLLLRFFDPETGKVLLDGVPLVQMQRSEFRKKLAFVPQDPVIFADTVMANIRFGWPEASDAQIMEAAKAAAAHEFITDLPNGYETYVGERGIMLSGGQKQRLAIARAILRNAPVLMLDEATSALDAESERAVQTAVERLATERTTLIVAHRLATVKKADRIVVLDKGRVVDQGTHEELVRKGGLYARLAKLQFTDGAAELA